jgi:metal transporter CNNM
METVFIFLLLALSALFSGLTIGLMSLDLNTLKLQAKNNNTNAAKVLGIREKGTQLLVMLLLANTFVNAILAVFMADKFSGLVAGFLTTVLIFLFGELLPQAVLTRHALVFGAKVAPFVRGLLFITHPITKPIAIAIDALLGKEIYKKYSKKELLDILEDESSVDATDVDTDERRIVKGSLSFSHRKVKDVLTPSTMVESLHIDDVINQERIVQLKESGYSRLPVQTDDRNQCVGILYLKDLLGVELPTTVRTMMDSTVHFVNTEDMLDAVLADFIKTKMHLFIVLDEFGTFQGVITLEDIVEEIIGIEIMDEDDEDADLRAVARAQKKLAKKNSQKQ